MLKQTLIIILTVLTLGSVNLSAQIQIKGKDFLTKPGHSFYTGVMVEMEDGTVIVRFGSIFTSHQTILADIEKTYGEISVV